MGTRWIALVFCGIALPACLLKPGPSAPRPFSADWVQQHQRSQNSRDAPKQTVEPEAERREKEKKPRTAIRLNEAGKPQFNIGDDQHGLSADVSAQEGGKVRLKHQWSW
ncbi:MAG: hypothetical protein HZB26_03805 [Candidatus Hydrogenedentes bacterium]|nr:hypothetical protein [Candidatus Hydrogenedentota bacterium]